MDATPALVIAVLSAAALALSLIGRGYPKTGVMHRHHPGRSTNVR